MKPELFNYVPLNDISLPIYQGEDILRTITKCLNNKMRQESNDKSYHPFLSANGCPGSGKTTIIDYAINFITNKLKNRCSIDVVAMQYNKVIGVSISYDGNTPIQPYDFQKTSYADALASRILHQFIENNHMISVPMTDFTFSMPAVFAFLKQTYNGNSFVFGVDELNKIRSCVPDIYEQILDMLGVINCLFNGKKLFSIVIVNDISYYELKKAITFFGRPVESLPLPLLSKANIMKFIENKVDINNLKINLSELQILIDETGGLPLFVDILCSKLIKNINAGLYELKASLKSAVSKTFVAPPNIEKILYKILLMKKDIHESLLSVPILSIPNCCSYTELMCMGIINIDHNLVTNMVKITIPPIMLRIFNVDDANGDNHNKRNHDEMEDGEQNSHPDLQPPQKKLKTRK